MQISDTVYYENKGFPDDIEITGFDQYDFFKNKPDMVYFDTPYDLYDAYLCVHPLFYTENIRKYAQKMIYVSCVLSDEYDENDLKACEMMRFCINTPGVSRADEVIVQSDKMREIYIRSLTKWAGEDTKKVWERKVKAGGLTEEEYNIYQPVSREELGEEWNAVLYRSQI